MPYEIEKCQVKRSVIEKMREQAEKHHGIGLGAFFSSHIVDGVIDIDIPVCAYGLACSAGLLPRSGLSVAAMAGDLGFSYGASDNAVRRVQDAQHEGGVSTGPRVPFDLWLKEMDLDIIED